MASTTEFSVIDEEDDEGGGEGGAAVAHGGGAEGGHESRGLLTVKSSDDLGLAVSSRSRAMQAKLMRVNFAYHNGNLTMGGVQFRC